MNIQTFEGVEQPPQKDIKIAKEHEIEILSYEMREKVLEKVVEISITEYITLERKMKKDDNEEKFAMVLCTNIFKQINKENFTDNNWQIIAGKNFGSFITHESFFFAHFKYKDFWFTIFVSA